MEVVVGKFRQGDIVVDVHGNEYKVIMTEGSSRVAIKSTETREPSKVVSANDIQKK